MKKSFLTLSMFFFSLALGGCKAQQQYVNLETANTEQAQNDKQHPQETTAKTDETLKDNTETEQLRGCDDSANCWYSMEVTANSKYIYTPYWRVNRETQTYGAFCSVVGCTHQGGNCETGIQRSGLRCFDEGVYYTSGDTIYYRNSVGEIQKIYTNTYSNDYTKKNFPKTDDENSNVSPEMLGGLIFADDHTLLVSGKNFFFLYDLSTGKATEPVDVCESYFLSFCILNGQVYSSDYNGELYHTDLETGVSERVLEQGYNVRTASDRLFYVKWVNGEAQICSNNAEFSDEVVEVSQSSPMFEVCGDHIVYYSADYSQILLHTAEQEILLLDAVDEISYPDASQQDTAISVGLDVFWYTDGILYFDKMFNCVDDAGNLTLVTVWYCAQDGVVTALTEE